MKKNKIIIIFFFCLFLLALSKNELIVAEAITQKISISQTATDSQGRIPGALVTNLSSNTAQENPLENNQYYRVGVKTKPVHPAGSSNLEAVENQSNSIESSMFLAEEEISEEEIGEDFILVLFPDTQTMVDIPEFNAYFESMSQYLSDNKENLNLEFATHRGDIVEDADDETQWAVADHVMGILDTAMIPYSVNPGNHDTGGFYNDYFGPERFLGNGYYQGSYEVGNNSNNYSFFSASDLDFIIINLQYKPKEEHISWANDLLAAHPDRRAIVVSHYILTTSGELSPTGQEILDGVKENTNLFLMLCGHLKSSSGAAYNRYTREGMQPVHIVLANYQHFPYGGEGYLRFFKFSPGNNLIYMYTESPMVDEPPSFLNEQPNKMNLPYLMNIYDFNITYFPLIINTR